MAKGNKVVITGTNYISILTMARDLGKAGYDISVIRIYLRKPGLANVMSSMEPEKESRFVKEYHSIVINDDGSMLRDLLLKIADDETKALLVPVDDFPVRVIDEHYDELSGHYLLPDIDKTAGEIKKLMDKGLQKELAVKAGLNTAKGLVIRPGEDLPELPDDIFPCYVKPSVSRRASKLAMGKCENIDELLALISSGKREEGDEFLAEQFIDAAHEHSVLGVCIEGVVKACAGFRSEMPGHNERQGVAVMGISEGEEFFAPVMDGIRSLMLLTGYTGMFDIDFLEDKAGKLYFLEINFRAGASCHAFSYEGGLNVPAEYAGAMLRDEDIHRETILESGKYFLSEKALLEEYVKGDVSGKEMQNCLRRADVFFVKDDEDTKPYKVFRRFLRLAPLLRAVYRFK